MECYWAINVQETLKKSVNRITGPKLQFAQHQLLWYRKLVEMTVFDIKLLQVPDGLFLETSLYQARELSTEPCPRQVEICAIKLAHCRASCEQSGLGLAQGSYINS